jgi:hypothetical protein
MIMATLPALLVYLWAVVDFDFYQDDAYITYRYVANYLGGDGLVYNIGEYVEGYTNFGWLVYLLFWGVLGFNYVLASKVTGIILGAVTIVVTLLVARLVFYRQLKWLALLPVYLVACNFSFPYWSQAGLETGAFVILAALSLYFFLVRHYLLIAVLTLAVLIRPEGALLAGLLIVIEAVVYKQWPRFTITCSLAAFALSLPYLFFKLTYYGSILPNPFYAKSGFDLIQITDGLEYAARFFKHYAYYAVALVVPVVFWRRLTQTTKAIWLFTFLFLLYVVLIGGDVLKVHRFFLPLLPSAALLVTLSIHLLLAKLRDRSIYLLSFLLALGLLGVTYAVPRDFIAYYERMEKGLTHKFRDLAVQIKQSDRTDFSVAVSTIGAFGYELLGHRVIDMLGLTDSTIARHPEPPIEGMESTWRERRYNSHYLLESAPDYIVFSTSRKPSSPAERALMLYEQFLSSYRTIGWYYRPDDDNAGRRMFPVFRRMRPINPPLVRTHPVEYVNNYIQGILSSNAGDYLRSQKYFQEARRLDNDPPYPLLAYQIAQNHFRLKEPIAGMNLLNEIVKYDSMVYEPHADLYLYEYSVGDRAKAAVHRRWLQSLMPWAVDDFDSLAHTTARKYGR